MNNAKRRTFLIAAGALFTALTADAQPAGKVYRIGFVRAARPPEPWIAGLQQGLRERGYVVGQNVVIEYRFADGRIDQIPRLVEELVRLNVDVIMPMAAPAALAARKVTKVVPIVFVSVHGPVEIGLVASLARPGGNITGLAISAADLAGKRLELLRECVPKLKRVAVLWRPENRASQIQLKEAESAARVMGVQLQALPISSPDDLEPAFKAARGADGLLQIDDPLFVTHRTRVAELAASSGLPAIYGFREYVESGSLMSYGQDSRDSWRRAATLVDKIFKGAKAGDLPVEQPTKFEFVINMRTAKALGLTIPLSLLLRADEVID